MTFTVTYRGKDGAKRVETVEAANRAECVAECKRRGIMPLGIQEGQSGKSAASPKSRRRDGGSHSQQRVPLTRKVVILAVAVLVVAGGVWWLLAMRETTRPPVVKPAPAKVEKPVPRQPVAKPAAPPKEEPKEEPRKVVPKGTPMSERKPPKTYRDENGILRYEGGARARDPNRPHHVAQRLGPDPLNDPVFKTRPENEIAMLLTARPGDTILALCRYDDAFEAQFMSTLGHDLEVTEDDTPAHAELKRAMAETKKELAERIKNGEKLADILEETRSELRRLADYRRNMEKMVADAARNPENTEQDVADYLTAANKMLTDNGLKPIKSGIVRKNILMRVRKAQSAEQGAQGK